MKYYRYAEYTEDGDVTVIMSLRQILRAGTEYAEKFYSGYPSAEIAIRDFIAINWAYECDKYGKASIGTNIYNNIKLENKI